MTTSIKRLPPVRDRSSAHGWTGNLSFASLGFAAGLTMFLMTVDPSGAGELVGTNITAEIGSIVVRTKERRLYLMVSPGRAMRYKVGVGRPDKQWIGESVIDGKYLQPNWAPPDEIKRDRPELPDVIEGGSPKNPMGAAALTLSGGSYAIHGTNKPASIGGFVSYGCIRMYNADIMDLFDRIAIGTPVIVTR